MLENIQKHVGQYIFDPKKPKIYKLGGEFFPYIKVDNIFWLPLRPGYVCVNWDGGEKGYTFELSRLKFIDEPEAKELLELFRSLKVQPSYPGTVDQTCFRNSEVGRIEKVKYDTEQKVLFSLFAMLFKNKELVAYKCPNCGYYHIGTKLAKFAEVQE